MENSLNNFEKLLSDKREKKTSIYDSKPIKQQTYRPQDVLDTVFSQIKYIQQADSVKNSKSKLSEKKSGFLVVENKPVYKEVHKQHKFDTQCITDTQLMNIIDNVEAIDAQKGITQEFDNTFIHTHLNDEITTVKIDKNEDKTPIKLEEIKNTHAIIKEDSFNEVFSEDEESMINLHEAILTKNTLNTSESNYTINMTTQQGIDNNMGNIFSKSHKEKNKETVDQTNSVYTHSLKEISVQSKKKDVANSFAQVHSERHKDTPIVINTSSDDLSVLADVNICVLNEQLNTEDIANIKDFEAYNTMPEYKVKEKPAEDINLSKELFTEDQLPFNELEKERTPSPVLNIRPKKVKCPITAQSFSVPLEVFENFEKTVMSFVEKKDKPILINSQILETELCLNLNSNLQIDAMLSPVIELSIDKLHISQKEIEEQINNQNILDANTDPIDTQIDSLTQTNFLTDREFNLYTKRENVKNIAEKASYSLKDEILFSSDEENEYAHKEVLDLPLTCALETSFYDEPDVLERTMYVGFQTASNKSIQIQTETFQRARSILSNDREFSLTELVEICDGKAKDIDMKVQKDLLSKTEAKSQSEDNQNPKVANKKVAPNEIPNKKIDFEFVGFQTANDKKINISKKAMTKISTVFKDLDLIENFIDPEGKIESKILKNMELPNKDSNQTDTNRNPNTQEDININDDLLIQEFENIEMSLEEKEANKTKSDFEGFKTASNKKIKISDKAMLHINNIFKDIDLDELNEDAQNPIYNIKQEITAYPNNSNFKAAVNTEYINYVVDLAFPSTSSATSEGFKTANNKIIKISDKAISITKNIFKDMNDTEYPVNDTEDKYEKYEKLGCNITKHKFEGFKTASNKSVKLSEEAIIKSKKLFQDLQLHDNFSTIESIKNTGKIQPKISHKHQDDANQQENLETPMFQGFKSANDKPVKVSETNLAKTRTIFENLGPKVDSISDAKNNNVTINNIVIFKGFQTANNKPVIVSEINLARSRKIFADLDENNSNGNTKRDTNKKQPYPTSFRNESPSFQGFTTANNKLVKITGESLAKSKHIFSDINDEVNTIENEPNTKSITVDNPVFKGFQTANRKPVSISKEALLRSKKIFQDIELNAQENININATSNSIAKTSSFAGSKTSNDEEVLFSEDTLEKNRIKGDNLKDSISNEAATKTDKFKFTGFQTASNKNVNISKEAMLKTKNIFKDIEIDKNDIKPDESQEIVTENDIQNCNIQNKSKYNMYTTANNKNISLSEEALKKSKQILSEPKHNNPKNLESDQMPKKSADKEPNTSINIDNIINTQVLNNFEDNLCTEDFQSTPRPPKRSTSPILSCPKAKKRKFQTPYKPTKAELIKETELTTITTYFEKDYKKNKIYKLKDIITIKKPIDPYVTNFNIDNLLNFEFIDERNDITDTKITVNYIKNIFQNGVNTKIVPEGWIDIQLKLILWKLLSYETKYNFICTARNVINQLKYRYDKELYGAERPALRKIMEKDDIPSKTLVLCVVGIYVDGVSVQSVNTTDKIELLLTDGWYFIKTIIDKMLSKLVAERKIYIGLKIVTNGAEILNCEQGVSPWEDTSQIKLKIYGNSTRPAPWDTKLGYHRSAILSDLTAVRIDGGKICKLRVFVTRVYPLLYVEKFEDGSTVTRSERLEYLHQIKYENDREVILEQIYEEVQKEFSDQESQDSESYIESGNKRRLYESGSQIAKMMKKCKDPMEFRAQLTSSQVQLLQDHSCKNRDRLISAIQDRIKDRFGQRNVVTLARGKIASVGTKGGQITVSTGMLSIWKPTEAILELFKENSWIEIMNVVPTAIRYSEFQLSAGRKSIFRQSKPKDETFASHLEKYKRKIYNIGDLTNKPVNDNEIDTVGLIFLIEPSIEDFDSTKHFQNVYLADENKNMICINFWGGIKKFGFLNVIDTGQIISCVNLQKRAGNTRKNIPQFRVTEFTNLTKTPKNAQSRKIIEDLNRKLGTNRIKFCEDCVAIQSNYSVIKCFDENSPYRINRSDYNISKHKMFIDTPLRNTKKDEFNLTGLDFESTFKQTDTELSPNTLLRKKKVNEKIAKLKMYGEPPPLSPINIINKSKNATKSYKSPLISKDDSVINLEANITVPNNVLTQRNTVKNNESPTFNRTYVKRNVNPIKLDFSKNIDQNLEETDGFVGDFDGSPPLSLE